METAAPSAVQLTRILRDWSSGDDSALERLTPVVYGELHRLARRNLARREGNSLLQPSALVNEAFVRLIGSQPVEWSSRVHFFAHASVLMRRILVDFARAQRARKRNWGRARANLSSIADFGAASPTPVNILDLDIALEDLAQLDARQAQVIELRYFGGLENKEVAEALGISEPTVIRDWRIARAWLFKRLQPASRHALTP
jgi:RNA polymerase sigma factor (TIGR02999 family)